MSETEPLHLFDFSAGLNVAASNALLAANETRLCKNCIFRAGAIVKRKGYLRYNAVSLGAGPVRGLFPYYKADGSRQMMIAHGGNLYAGTKDGVVGDPIRTSMADTDCSFTTWLDKCYTTNGSDPVLRWDGGTLSELGSAKKGKYLVDYMERLFTFNVGPDQQSFLWWSDLGDPSSWGPNNYLAISTDDGDVGTGLAVLPVGLLAFKNRSTWMVYGNDFDPVTSNVEARRLFPLGCVAPKSIAYVGNAVVWLAGDGVYSYDGGALTKLSNKVDPILEACSRKERAVGGTYQHYYWLAYTSPGGTDNDSVLVLDLNTGAWTRFTNMSIGCMSVLSGRADFGELLTGSEQEGLLYWQDTGSSDDGAPIPMEWHSKYFNMGGPEWDKVFRKLAVDVLTTGARIDVDYDIDSGVASGTFTVESSAGLGMWGDGGKWGDGGIWNAPIIKPFSTSLPMTALGRNLKLIVRNNDANPDVNVSGLIVRWWPKRMAI